MHYHCEIILPPTEKIEEAVEQILSPFDENSEEAYRPFWDWYVIGGRWSGSHQKSNYGKEKLSAFWEWINQEKITVANFRAGKYEIRPEEQIEKVDSKWNEMFPRPDGLIVPCPLFKHAGEFIEMDICELSEINPELECERVIIASLNREGDEMEGIFMLSREFYNGINHQVWMIM